MDSSGAPHGQVVDAVAIGVAGGEAEAEHIARLDGAGNTVHTLVKDDGVGPREAVRCASQHRDGAGVRVVSERFEGGADGQLVAVVAVEVACSELGTPLVELLVAAGHSGRSLVEQDRPGTAQPARRAVEDGDRAGRGDVAHGSTRRAHRHIVVPIAVEVADGQVGTEEGA